ncbi:hypothetical protein N9V38_02155 [Planktomarina temperata]|nr:hypothetical protein [Planktomarina temperata]
MLSTTTSKSLLAILALCLIAIAEAISINILGSELQSISVGLIVLFLISSISHTVVPVLVNLIASEIFQIRFANITQLKSISNYLVLERGIQTSEQIYLNLTTANIILTFRSIQICLIVVVILTINLENVFAIIIVGLFFILVNYAIRKFALNSISNRISSKFEFISNVRSSSSIYAKGMYFNKRTYDNAIVNENYLEYFKLLALQNGISGFSRTSFDIIAATIIIFLLTTNDFDINQIAAYGWAGLRVIPAIQQVLFYYNIKRTTQKIYDDTLSLEPKYIDFIPLPGDGTIQGTKFQLTGISGSGKSSYLDFWANQHQLKNLGYYTQNFVPIFVSKHEAQVIRKYSWAPAVDSGLLKKTSGQYSEGQLQRIAVALILADPQADILMFDEPFSSQSEEFMQQMAESICEDKRPCLLVSHVGTLKKFNQIDISRLSP